MNMPPQNGQSFLNIDLVLFHHYLSNYAKDIRCKGMNAMLT